MYIIIFLEFKWALNDCLILYNIGSIKIYIARYCNIYTQLGLSITLYHIYFPLMKIYDAFIVNYVVQTIYMWCGGFQCFITWSKQLNTKSPHVVLLNTKTWFASNTTRCQEVNKMKISLAFWFGVFLLKISVFSLIV
jgi:hypothetical protein